MFGCKRYKNGDSTIFYNNIPNYNLILFAFLSNCYGQ
jgi:hypothetical protein